MSDLASTLAGMFSHKWHVVLLGERSKRPTGEHWQVVTSGRDVVNHCQTANGNIGLVCGEVSGTVVLDFDKPGALAEMTNDLGPLQPWVETMKGVHCYVKWEDGLPASIRWKDQIVGQIQRGPALQHVVLPPSVHPDTGRQYRWLVDPSEPLPELPEKWREFLREDVFPSWVKLGTREEGGLPEPEEWAGPPPEELIRRALFLPGARRRRFGVKFQCPGCRAEGHDRHMDNAVIHNDGHWGCALSEGHSAAIGEALSVASVSKEVLGDDADDLKDVSLDDLD